VLAVMFDVQAATETVSVWAPKYTSSGVA
jgi:hypothetical protein